MNGNWKILEIWDEVGNFEIFENFLIGDVLGRLRDGDGVEWNFLGMCGVEVEIFEGGAKRTISPCVTHHRCL